MPSLPSKTIRRKHVRPVAHIHDHDNWLHSYKHIGLIQAVTPGAPTMEGAEAIGAPEGSASISAKAKRKLGILELPQEVQEAIFRCASSTDLVALSLVSKRFRDLAAAHLYRNFHIVFPDDDDPGYDSPIDGLAGGLDTFVTSEYDYARYIKEIVLGTFSGGAKGERAYKHYTADLSCGKFMNTLFLLTLRKAKALEKFKWDLRVELSRPVFKALHKITALQNLYIRMQAGPSIYEVPPPLPSLADNESDSGASTTSSTSSGAVSFATIGTKSYSITKQKPQTTKSPAGSIIAPNRSEPPTFSGFKNLKTLAILELDTLDYTAEINECIKNSSSTLTKLKLSFSESVARKARKPPPADDTGDDSDQETDEFGNMINPPAPPQLPVSDDAAGPAKAFRAQEEKKRQEAVLGLIFGIEHSQVKTKDEESTASGEEDEKVADDFEKAAKQFIKEWTALPKKLMASVNGTGARTQQQKEVLEVIEAAARKFVAFQKDKVAKDKAAEKATHGTASEGSTTAKATPVSSVQSVVGKVEEDVNTDSKLKEPEAEDNSKSLFHEEDKEKKAAPTPGDEMTPDDIDIDEPEVEVDLQELEEASGLEPPPIEHVEELDRFSPQAINAADDEKVLPEKVEKNEDTIKSLKEIFDTYLFDTYQAQLQSLQEKFNSNINMEKASQLVQQSKDFRDALGDLNLPFQERWPDVFCSKIIQDDEEKAQISEYVRTTRGLALNTLSIYLIPIKASVLGKAIDVNVLERITLLNVGPQAAFWNLLIRENKSSPLPLRKIHTDNVSGPFLSFVSQLESLAELFMLERNSKSQEYSFAPKTTVTIDNIRRQILKKHTGTLKRLVIKNENDYTWDANEKVLELLCRKGKKLEELGICFSSRAVHTLLQYLPGLVNLRALHIIQFRNDDTCHWVLREIRKFVVDNVSHHPHMKIEYVALDGNVERLIRRVKKPKLAAAKGKDKGKGVEGTPGVSGNAAGSAGAAFPMLTELLQPGVEESSEEDEDDDEDYGGGLKVETLESGRFYDVYGVRMWRKDVLMGRL